MTTEKKKNNIKLPIIIAILVVVIAGGAYGYRTHQINTLRTEAISNIEQFDVSKYDGKELKDIEKYVEDSTSKLEASKDPEEFTKIVDKFNEDTAKVKTTAQKEKERKEREEAERKAREEAERAAAEAAAAAAAAHSSSRDSGGCVGGGSSAFY